MFNSSHKIFRYFLWCFMIGVGVRSFWAVDYLPLLVVGLLGILGFLKQRTLQIFLIGFALAGLGIFRYQIALPVTNETKVWFYNDKDFTTQAVVVKEPDVRLDHTKLLVKTVGDISGKILVKTNLYPAYRYGDLLEISCRLRTPTAFDGFAYDRYLAKDYIYSVCYYPAIKLLAHNQGDIFFEKLFLFKNRLTDSINLNLPEPQASFFAALMLGSRQGLPDDLFDRFSLTGTIHIISISGLHITILSTLVIRFLISLYLSRLKAFWVLTVLLMLYLMLIGFPPAAVRAAVMGWFAVLALNVGRLNQSSNTILFAASAMLVVNPKIFRDDIGFQLSCAAMFGLIYFFPFINERLKIISDRFGIREAVAMTLSAQLTTTPLVAVYFGNFSIVAPVVNVLIVPTLPPLMIFGLVSLVGSLIFPVLGFYLFWPVLFLLQYIILVVNLFSRLFFAGLTF